MTDLETIARLVASAVHDQRDGVEIDESNILDADSGVVPIAGTIRGRRFEAVVLVTDLFVGGDDL